MNRPSILRDFMARDLKYRRSKKITGFLVHSTFKQR